MIVFRRAGPDVHGTRELGVIDSAGARLYASLGDRRRGARVPVFRYSAWDALLVLGAMGHAIVLICFPSIWVIAVALWWNANSVSHYFVHLPFFRREWQNRLFSAFLSLLLGIPQRLWRDRHLAHHAELPTSQARTGPMGSGCRVPVRMAGRVGESGECMASKQKRRDGAAVQKGVRYSEQLMFESLLVAALWIGMIAWDWEFVMWTYGPGWALGMTLCQMHGYFEHYRGTTSHYGRLYNLVFFNDGCHIEHHLRPAVHWRSLSRLPTNDGNESGWPAVLRFLELFTLEGLERIVLLLPRFQNWILRLHRDALRRVLVNKLEPQRVAVVGGGLFPRTAIVLRELFPGAELWIIDASERNLEIAQHWIGGDVRCVHAWYDRVRGGEFDMVTIPLAYRGDRESLYAAPPARITVVHDWIWRRRGSGVVVSWLLLKRINVVEA